jgi:hypothetical protein
MNLELCNKEFNRITGLDPQYFNEPRVWEMPIFKIGTHSSHTNKESENSLDVASEINETPDIS